MRSPHRRVLRLSAIVAASLALVLAGIIGANTALAGRTSTLGALAPTAPFTIFTADGHGWGIVGSRALLDVDFNANGERVSFYSGIGSMRADMSPPIGSTWTAGTTYETRDTSPSATYAIFHFGSSTACSGTRTGSLTVHEVVRSADQITAFAATYMYVCDATHIGYGELRFNSSVGYKIAHNEQASFDFQDVFIGDTTAPITATYIGRGSEPTTFGAAKVTGPDAGSFTISHDGCAGVTLGYDQTCSVSVVARSTTLGQKYAELQVPEDEVGGFKQIRLYANGVPQPENLGKYYGLPANRILDTRVGNGATKAKVGPGGQIDVRVTVAGVPDQGVSAVVLNVTVTNPTAAGYVTVWPAGVARPTASSLNVTPGWTGANMVTVGVGAGGKVSIFNANGSVDVIADVVGYYNSTDYMLQASGPASYYDPIVPSRLFDSRFDLGYRVPGGYAVHVPFSFGPEIDPTVKAIAVNVTAVDPVGAGYFTAWDGAWDPPLASTLNFAKGGVVPNMAIVPLCRQARPEPGDRCLAYPSIAVYTNVSAHVIVDIVGVFHNGATGEGLRFEPATPRRITDSRDGFGLPAALGQAVTGTVTVPGSIADESTYGLAMNVTAVSPTQYGYVSVWPADIPGVGQPLVSNLNTAPGKTLPNSVYTLIGPEHGFNVYNNAGSTHIVIDVVGRFYLGSERGLPTLAARGAGFTASLRSVALDRTDPAGMKATLIHS